MRYWLFKSEPGCFSFDDLKSRPGGVEHWDGVRNYQARNYLRDEVQVGDLVLFYHSNIPEPEIVGVASVVRAGYPDFTARDSGGEHFDPKSSADNPIWYMVDVRYERPFKRPVTLAELKRHPELEGMPLLNRSRLSIQPLRDEEWRLIVGLGGVME
jgi:predicted RNA-binding protein with PUA-like domain